MSIRNVPFLHCLVAHSSPELFWEGMSICNYLLLCCIAQSCFQISLTCVLLTVLAGGILLGYLQLHLLTCIVGLILNVFCAALGIPIPDLVSFLLLTLGFGDLK